MRPLIITVILIVSCCKTVAQTYPIDVCTGGDRAERKVTCIHDGDTGWENGVKWRMLGIDTPEISRPGCMKETQTGYAAHDRLVELMGSGYMIRHSGKVGRYGRPLVDVILADGRNAGRVLLSEGLAQPWPNRGNIWCD